MKIKMRKLFYLFAVVMMAAALSSCAGGKKKEQAAEPAAEKAEAPAKKIIGVSLLKENDDFYITLKKGLQEAAVAAGYDIEILSADNDEMKQDRNMDALLLKNVSAVVICPVNSKGVGPIIQKATDKGIPVFTADIAAEQGAVVAHIASDNYQGGQIAAERMAVLLGGKGKIALVQQPGTESVAARVQGFVDKAKDVGLEIYTPYLNGKDDTQESERAAHAAIMANPDLKGIFAANDNMAMGAEQAIISSNKDIKLIGYDAAPAAQQRIAQDGAWKADVIQFPYEIGKITVQTIDEYFKGNVKAQSDGKALIVPVKVGLVDAESIKGAAK
jgi:ribose transport system substrate-binding protein